MEVVRPSGTVTFLFTDIEGSTVLWDRFPRLMAGALARHDALLLAAIAAHRGFVFAPGGDGFGAAFGSASEATAAAVEAQRALVSERWPEETVISVRMGLHTGAAEARGDNYFGTAVNRAARVAALARGGQVVLSAASAALVADDGWALTDVGLHRLKGLERSERLYRLQADGMTAIDLPLLQTGDVLGNLPHQRARLVGRGSEQEALGQLLSGGGLVTVTGVGGVGKSRLAVAAAHAAADRFADGVWFVELGQLVAPVDVASAAATSLRVYLRAGVDTAGAVAAALVGQQRLIVLDNCEHVIEAVVGLVEELGKRCPDVSVLATSREALGVDGERLLPLRPLAVDGEGGTSDAARLFRERAAGLLGHFEPAAVELAALDDICRRLDGLPLAIELAAARLPVMSLKELDERLVDSFQLLTRRRSSVARHQSLWATVAWSYDILTPSEQMIFDRLSVFAGSFDLAAAKAVGGGPPLTEPVDELLASLVDKSMLTAASGAGGTRYQQLETLRQFGDERLEARGARIRVRRRHLDHFMAWVEEADAGVKGPEELRCHQAFLAEWHNLRNAIGWACELDDADAASRLLCKVYWWASTRVRLEMADWSDAVVEMPSASDHPLRPIVLASASYFAAVKNDHDKAGALLTLAGAEEERLGPAVEPWVPVEAALEGLDGPTAALANAFAVQRRGLATGDGFWVLIGRLIEAGLLAPAMSGDLTAEERASHLERIRDATELADASAFPTGIAWASMAMGVALRKAEPSEALALLERSLDMFDAAGAESFSNEARFNLASHYIALDRALDAVSLLGPALRAHVQAGAWGEARVTMAPLPGALAELRRPELAATILGVARAAPGYTADWETYHARPALEARLRAELGSPEIERLLDEGAHLPIARAAALVLEAIEELVG